MFWLRNMTVLSDVAVIFFSSIVVLTSNGNFWVLPLFHSGSHVTFYSHILRLLQYDHNFIVIFVNTKSSVVKKRDEKRYTSKANSISFRPLDIWCNLCYMSSYILYRDKSLYSSLLQVWLAVYTHTSMYSGVYFAPSDPAATLHHIPRSAASTTI